MKPLVSVLIPTYNRTEDLQLTLSHVKQLSYPAVEIVIVDDCSTQPEIALLAKESGAKYVRMEINRGLLGARNEGLKHCAGKYVLNLDDDSWLVESAALETAVEYFERDDRLAVLALNIKTSSSLEWPESIDALVPVPYYIGCGNLYRRAAISDVGPYEETFVRQGEEAQRTMKLLNVGWRVLAATGIVVYHNVSPVNRNVRRNMTFEVANHFRRETLHAPAALLPVALLRICFFAFGQRGKFDVKLLLKLLASGNASLMKLLIRREPVSLSSYLIWARMSWDYSVARMPRAKYALKWRV